MADWNANQYMKFDRERTQPSVDLLNRIPLDTPKQIIDIGCGPGNSTAVLRSRYQNAKILGVDSSASMIERAKKDYPELSFALCDVPAGLRDLDQKFDLVFSNACLQWIPDHVTLIPKLMELLNPGGILAVQVPMNAEEPAYRVITDIISSPGWQKYFASLPPDSYILSPSEYCSLLSDCSGEYSLWQTRYFYSFSSQEQILEWVRGTRLRPYLAVLSESERRQFEAEILKGIVDSYPAEPNGSVLFRFLRLFFIAEKKL